MARTTFGGGPSDFIATRTSGAWRNAGPTTLTFWSDEAGGLQYTDLVLNGQPATSIRTGSEGRIPAFSGPDGIGVMWLQAPGMSQRVRLVAKSDEAVAAALEAAQQAEAAAELAQQVSDGIAEIVSQQVDDQVPPAVTSYLSGIDVVQPNDFTPDTTATLFGFPNNVPPGTYETTRLVEMTAAALAPGTADINGTMTTFGGKNVVVRFNTGTGGTWGNTVYPGGMSATAGTGTTYMTVDVGAPAAPGTVISRMVVGGVSADGTQKAMGCFLSGTIVTNNVRFIRTTIATSNGTYGFQLASGTTLANVNASVSITSPRVAQPGDVVELIRDPSGLIRMRVNSVTVATYQLKAAEISAYTGTLAGLYHSFATSSAGNYMTLWRWDGPALVSQPRSMVTVGATGILPDTVSLSTTKINAIAQKFNAKFDIRDYGAKCDAIVLTDASMASGSTTLTSATYLFTQADVGKAVAVMGAGTFSTDYNANANDGVLVSTIASVNDTTGSATLASPAVNTLSGGRAVFGTPDDAAFVAARDAAVGGIGLIRGAAVWIPAARTIVTKPLPVKDYVSWIGAGSDLSWVHVIFSAPGTDSSAAAGTCDWLTCAGKTSANPLTGATFRDFAVEAEAHIRPGGYTTSLKPLNIYHVKRCSIINVQVRNTPATSIPFDHAYEHVVIAHNLIVTPGRLWVAGRGGGSGIGIGVTDNPGKSDPSLVFGNTILGTAGRGQNGIFIESQSGSNQATMDRGYRIVNNYIENMTHGIAESGGLGTIIGHNVIVGCVSDGISIDRGGVAGGILGRDTIVDGNFVYACTGPGSTDGVGIRVFSEGGTSSRPQLNSKVRTRITNNVVTNCKSWGIDVFSDVIAIDDVTILGNAVRDNGRSGVRLASGGAGSLGRLALVENDITGNGTLAISGDTSAILVSATMTNPHIDRNRTSGHAKSLTLASGKTLTGGSIRDNDFPDGATISGTLGAGLVVQGNQGWDGGGTVSVTPGASPWTYTAGAFPVDLYLDGGTGVSVTKAGVVLGAPTQVRLKPGQPVTVTYTTAPTVIADRL